MIKNHNIAELQSPTCPNHVANTNIAVICWLNYLNENTF